MIAWDNLPNGLEPLRAAKNKVRKADSASGPLVRRHVGAHIDSALVNVLVTPGILRAQEVAVSASIKLGAYLEDRGSSAEAANIEQLKAEALISLDRLLDALEESRPTDRAKALGLGW
jgi:hypothetical protein